MTEKQKAGEEKTTTTTNDKLAPPVWRTWTLNLNLGLCNAERMEEIRSIVNNWEGFERSVIDVQEGVAWVKGTVAGNALLAQLKEKLKKVKKDDDKKGKKNVFVWIKEEEEAESKVSNNGVPFL